MRVNIAGTGPLAQVFATVISGGGDTVTLLSRDPKTRGRELDRGPAIRVCAYEEVSPQDKYFLIAVKDSAIEAVSAQLAGGGVTGGVVLHTCGSRSTEALQPLAGCGFACGVLHPLQTVPGGEPGAAVLRSAFVSLEGDEKAVTWAARIAEAAGAIPVRIEPGTRAHYHAAAVMASNFLITLLDASFSLMEKTGMDRDQVRASLAPLAGESLRNAVQRGPVEALTGPIARGDVETVLSHLQAVEGTRAAELYKVLALRTLELAKGKGLSAEAERKLREKLAS